MLVIINLIKDTSQKIICLYLRPKSSERNRIVTDLIFVAISATNR